MIEIRICPICNGSVFVPFITCLDHSISREKFTLIKCTQCELVITSPRPSNDHLGKYYTSPAYTSHINQAKNTIDQIYLVVRNFTLRWKLALLKKYTSSTEKRLLDFGCGTGEFLKVAKSNGWQTMGMEPSHNARTHSDEIVSRDIRASLQEVLSTKEKFDAITLWHVLEHIEDLNSTIQNLKSILVQNGTIFIAVPNHSSWDGQRYKEHWAGYDVPRHLWHFGMKNIKLLMEKNSLTVTKIIPMRLDAFYITLLSEKYRNHDSFSITGMISALLNAFKSNYSAKKNLEYSSLIYVVKK